MSKTLALCLNSPGLQQGFLDPEFCSQYPGAGYLPYLARLAKDAGYTVLGGAQAATLAATKAMLTPDVRVFQEEMNGYGWALVELGARPSVVWCGESKMYIPSFYDHLAEIKRTFKRQILFTGGTDRLYFPSFDLAELDKPRPAFHSRKPICMIASNKQYWSLPQNYDSPAFCSAVRNELHSWRLRAIEAYADEDLDLFGVGWDHLGNLPPHWAHLREKIARCYRGPVHVGQKLEVLSQYQYAVCYENVAEPGYITEKMIDCLVAGTKPLYRGPLAFSLSGQTDPIIAEKDLPKYSFQAFAQTVFECVEADA